MGALISIIVPVYQAERYLERCLDSIVVQTYRNFEIIVVDDGSPDKCPEICDQYALKDPRIHVIHQSNKGVSAARNAGLDAATGDYFGFVDADDWIEPDMYAYLLRLAERESADIVQCADYLESAAERLIEHAPPSDICITIAADNLPMVVWKYFSNATWSKLYRRTVFSHIRYDDRYPIGEDLDFNLNCLKHGNRLVIGASACYHYVQHGNSTCRQAPSEEQLLSYRNVLLHWEEAGRGWRDGAAYLRTQRFRDDLDICSKIVRFGLSEPEIFRKLRREVRQNLSEILSGDGISRKEKKKAVLLAWATPLYRSGVCRSHRRRNGDGRA